MSEKIAKMLAKHKVLAEFYYDPVELDKGYANRTLRVDIGAKEIEIRPVTQQMKDLWTGGKGFDLWLMFQEINKDTKWDSPENPICFSSGPLGGVISFPGSGKMLVTSVSPLTHSIIDCNVGGYFGPYLKFAGFDALMLTGKSKDEIVIVIDASKNRITIETAPLESIDSHLIAEELTKMFADNMDDYKNISVVSSGTAANYSRIGILNFSFWDWRRNVARLKQAGRGGIGRVFRDKKVKALLIKNRTYTPAWSIAENKVAKEFESKICKCATKVDKAKINEIIDKWNKDREYVIEMMQDIQDHDRYISREAIDLIAKATLVPKAVIYHIATFYKAFSLTPRGETVIQVCTGTTCHVKGSTRILNEFERRLEIATGQTTKDDKFTLEAVGCLGCCSLAPVAKIGDEIHGHLQAKDIAKTIEI